MAGRVPSYAGWLAGGVLLAALFAGTGVLLRGGPEPHVDRPAPVPREFPSEPGGLERDILVVLDLDGDGRQDRVTLRGTDELDAEWAVSASMANGARATTKLPLVFNVAAWPVDINDDGQEELVVRTGGNTWTTGTLLVLDGGELQTARWADGPVVFGWNAHSNCCPGGTADVACGAAAGGTPRLVITMSQLVSPTWDGRWPITENNPWAAFETQPQRRAWDRTVYRLEGATLVEVGTDRGVIVGDDPEPAGLPLRNALDCDGAQD